METKIPTVGFIINNALHLAFCQKQFSSDLRDLRSQSALSKADFQRELLLIDAIRNCQKVQQTRLCEGRLNQQLFVADQPNVFEIGSVQSSTR